MTGNGPFSIFRVSQRNISGRNRTTTGTPQLIQSGNEVIVPNWSAETCI